MAFAVVCGAGPNHAPFAPESVVHPDAPKARAERHCAEVGVVQGVPK